VQFHRIDPIAATTRQMECGRIDLKELTIAHEDSLTDLPEINSDSTGWPWKEQHADGKLKIARPRQIYIGNRQSDYVPIDQRGTLSGKGERCQEPLFVCQ
jgi:hypothetical protein